VAQEHLGLISDIGVIGAPGRRVFSITARAGTLRHPARYSAGHSSDRDGKINLLISEQNLFPHLSGVGIGLNPPIWAG
jgi:hypothetical protein